VLSLLFFCCCITYVGYSDDGHDADGDDDQDYDDMVMVV
jgi:hypothetical protein